MKLRYLFTAIISALLFVSCSEDNEPAGNLGSISLSETYVSLPTEGGSATVAVSATQDWKFENVIFSSETGKTQLVTTKDTVDAWFTVSHVSGTAGQSELVFSADAFEGGREVELQINVGGNTQFLMVRQGTAKAVMATCAEVLAGTDGKTYKIKGTCTSIANTTYGNWYINDGTGEVYIYGTLDSKGATKNFASWGLEVGDVVELEGPRTTYGSTVELVDVTIIKITKSLVKVVTEEANIAKEGGELEVKVAFKGNGAYVSVPEECQSWVHLANTEYVAGEATKIEPNPADTAVFTFNIMANEAGARTGSMEFTSGSSTVSYTFSQEGAIANVTVA
ncbi:MAG: BACON domain-containing protein, partial [Prevotella sp.]|nr:BACON domain-containing protein [Prevotella sp.]